MGAKGHPEQGGNRLYFHSKNKSAKDQIGHTRLKRRKHVQVYETAYKFKNSGSGAIKVFDEIDYSETKNYQEDNSSYEKRIKDYVTYNTENVKENLDMDDGDTDDEES